MMEIFNENTIFTIHSNSRRFEVYDFENETAQYFDDVQKAVVYTAEESKAKGWAEAETLELTLADGSTVQFDNLTCGLIHKGKR